MYIIRQRNKRYKYIKFYQYFDVSLKTLIDLENYLIFKQINLE